LTILNNKKLVEREGILLSDEFDDVTKKVVEFYKENPFPNYDDNDTKSQFFPKVINLILKI